MEFARFPAREEYFHKKGFWAVALWNSRYRDYSENPPWWYR